MKKRLISLLLAVLLQAALLPAGAVSAEESAKEADSFTDFAVLSTTDMHGKCWNTNVLTGGAENNNMLRVSTAVRQIREEYGKENVLLIDNGDLFQGTLVSQVQLLRLAAGQSADPPAMALCLKEIGYDVFVLGNHEFDYDWATMCGVYRWMQENGIAVLAANVCHNGSDPAHPAGENAFTPYLVKPITVNGHEHKIGILGLENMDVTRWDNPANYPGLRFFHPENGSCSIAWEAERGIARMKEEGCEFIIVSYHGGIGNPEPKLAFGISTEDQGERLVRESEGIDLLILGHDHSSGYSDTFLTDRGGKQVPIVNGGGQELTRTVFRFSEDDSGALKWQLLTSENLALAGYETDTILEEKIRPYAELAEEDVESPVGTAAGNWDESTDYYLCQADSIDLICAAMITSATGYMREKYGKTGLDALKKATGLDHLDVDLAITTVLNDGYTVRPGNVSMKDIYSLYRFSNTMFVLPMYGRDIRAVMEGNAADRLTARVLNGKVHFYSHGDQYTHLIFGGTNYVCDMSKPAGERIRIESFHNGRAFEENTLYLVAVNDYILGNDHCGLRAFGPDDAVWSQEEEGNGQTIPDSLADYIRKKTKEEGAVTPDSFFWHWEILWSADPASLPPYEGTVIASLAARPEDGHSYILYHEAEGATLTARGINGGLAETAVAAYGNDLVDFLPEDALLLTVHMDGEGRFTLADAQGRYLTANPGGGLGLYEEPAADGRSLWQTEETDDGWILVNAGSGLAMQYYMDRFTTYAPRKSGHYIFNFYEP